MTKVEELEFEGLKTNSWSSSIEDSHVLRSCVAVVDPDPDFEITDKIGLPGVYLYSL